MEIVDGTKNQVDTSTEVRARIDRALKVRTAPRGTRMAHVEHVVKDGGQRLWKQLKKRPSLGVALVGATGLGLAMTVGVGELAIAAIAGYAAWQVLREGVPPKQAVENAVKEIEKL